MPAKNHPKKILVVRNDKLGDFVLSFPAFATLKTNMPRTEIHALVPAYTAPLAEMCSYIDHIVIDTDDADQLKPVFALATELKQQQYDAVITLFSTTRVAIACWLAGIPIRIAPATKIAQVLYNHRVKQRRSRSAKPEFEYNRDLANIALDLFGTEKVSKVEPPFLVIEPDLVATTRQAFNEKYGIPQENRLVFIHPGSGGSARNLTLQQYAQLLNQLDSASPFSIVISCAPAEQDIANNLAGMLETPHVVYISDAGLCEFVNHIAMADLFISGSTGPLHIAGALDVNTVGFYPRRQSATALRWQTLNHARNRLAISPPEDAEEEDMQAIDIGRVAAEVNQRLM